MEGAREGWQPREKGGREGEGGGQREEGGRDFGQGEGEGAARVRGEEEAPSWPTNWPAQHGLSYLGPEAQDPKPHRR